MTQDSESLAEGTLISHLLELRNRLMRAFLGVILVFIPCAIYSNELFELIARPLMAKLPANGMLVATDITAPFTTPFKLSFVVAAVLAMPYVIFELWRFIAPGLYRNERRIALPILVSAIVLFYIGASFAYFAVFPVIFEFFISTAPKGVAVMTDITKYLDFVLVLVFAFGAAFEMPVAVVLLVAMGVVSVEKLRAWRGYVLIIIFIVAAILTPPDAVSQCIMAIPMYLLYECGILFGALLNKRRAREAAQES
ncbi:MAG: twin-arginine translocase subunit TatC [Steroidobacteraceae bacterium]